MAYYKIGIIGFGSIGSRHLVNISNYLTSRNIDYSIDLIRRKSSKRISKKFEKYINNMYSSYEKVPNDYDMLFITNPTHLHYETIKKYNCKTEHMFIEKPVFDDVNKSIKALELKDGRIYYVACPLRYTDVIQYIKNEIDLSKVYSVRVICSSYLPDWRPDVDYRNTYSANSKQGGGVSIDLIHEWDYIQYLFGQPDEVHSLRGNFSNLEINSEDLSIYIAKYKKMLVEVHLDYFGKKTIREIQLFTDNDTIIADIVNSEISFLKSGKLVSFKESRNDFQLKEIKYFFDIIEGKMNNHNDIRTAIETLKIAKDE